MQVLSAKKFIGDEPFAVVLGDDIMISDQPALKQMMEVFEKEDREVVGTGLHSGHHQTCPCPP